MKVTENLVIKDYSKLVSAILADQVNRHQQLLLTMTNFNHLIIYRQGNCCFHYKLSGFTIN